MTSALEGDRDHALVLWAGSGLAMRKDLRMRRHESAQGLVVLVIDEADFAAAEVAGFSDWWEHNRLD